LLKDCGAELWICATSDRIYERAQEIGAQGFVGDLSDAGVVKELQEKIPNLDILVNNAGMTSISSPAGGGEATTLDQISLNDWHKGMARNIDTAFLVTRAFLPALRKTNGGRIIMMSSVTGKPNMALLVTQYFRAGLPLMQYQKWRRRMDYLFL